MTTATLDVETQTDPSHTPTAQSAQPVLGSDAYHGILGEFVGTVASNTEAHPAAIGFHLLAGFGALIGRRPRFMVGDTAHHARLFGVMVGPTGMGRKGLSAGPARRVLNTVDVEWAGSCIHSGLSTGEGLIALVRDVREGELDQAGMPLQIDPRCFVIEEEFGRVLAVKGREHATLSPVLRSAWDGVPLEIVTKANPIRASEPHIVIVGHVTEEELLSRLTSEDQANGFANRFLWVHTERIGSIPRPRPTDEGVVARIAGQLQESVKWVRSTGHEITWSDDAGELWDSVYANLGTVPAGFLGAMLSRGQPQVIRLALHYALLDRSPQIRVPHLKAGLAWWDYNARTLRWLYKDTTGDPVADRILDELRVSTRISRSALYKLFNNRVSATELDRARKVLGGLGRLRVEMVGAIEWWVRL